jgi:hypothetical protein
MTMSGHDQNFDELASAYLDGELDAADRAVVEGDSELRTSVESFASLSDQIQSGVETPAGSFDSALDAIQVELDRTKPALADYNPIEVDETPSNVVPFKKRRLGAFAGLGVAAAAVIGLVVVAGPSNDGDGSDPSTAAAPVPEESAEFDAAESGSSDAATERDSDKSAPDVAAGLDESEGASEASPLLDALDPATLLIEIDRIAKRIDLLHLEAVDDAALSAGLNRALDKCGFDGDVVLVDAIDEVEVVVIDSGDRLAIIVIPESCEVITTRPIG